MADKMVAITEDSYELLRKFAAEERRTLKIIIEKALNEYKEKHKKSS